MNHQCRADGCTRDFDDANRYFVHLVIHSGHSLAVETAIAQVKRVFPAFRRNR